MTDTLESFQNQIVAEIAAMKLPSKVLLAVSGGRDSMVLANLCAQVQFPAGTEFIAVTIDHGLRAEAVEEAKQAGRWCKLLGLTHIIVTPTESVNIETGIQQRARNLRYGLLLKAAYEHGCGAILTAHTQTDLAETLLMRLARGAGAAGLSGIHRERMIAYDAETPIRLMRPLLSVSRETVTAYAQAKEISYVNDPGNQDPAFERIRYRALIGALEEQDLLDARALALTAERLRKSTHQQEALRKQQFREAGGLFLGWGAIQFDRQHLVSDDHASMIGWSVYAIGGSDYPPGDITSAACLEKALQTGGSTLSGAYLFAGPEKLIMYREPAALKGRGRMPNSLSLAPGKKAVWDRRLVFQNRSNRQLLRVDMASKNERLVPQMGVPSRCLPSLAHLSWEDGRGYIPAIPNVLPKNVRMTSLLPERFDGNVIRYFA